MIIKLLTEHHLEFLSLTGGCGGSSESTIIKMTNCWKSHAMAHILLYCCISAGYSIFAKVFIYTFSVNKGLMALTLLDQWNFPQSLTQLSLDGPLYYIEGSQVIISKIYFFL